MEIRCLIYLCVLVNVAFGSKHSFLRLIKVRKRRQGGWASGTSQTGVQSGGRPSAFDYESADKAAEAYLNRHVMEGAGFGTRPPPTYAPPPPPRNVYSYSGDNGADDDLLSTRKRVIPVKRQEPKEAFWCYACASPRSTVHHDLVSAMDQLYAIRGAKYPSREYILTDCDRPRTLAEMKKETCEIGSFCYTGYFHDTVSGRPLTVRGCAHRYHAINTAVIGENGLCRRPHPSLEIEECICRNQNYCVDPSLSGAANSVFTKALLLFSTGFAILTMLVSS